MKTFATVQALLRTCMQCGTCTGSCPNNSVMDLTPRKLWRMVLMNRYDRVFNSQTFSLCSSCYCCTLRCPRGLPLTRAMAMLKSIAVRENFLPYRKSSRFYTSFMESVRRHGRVRETEFMTLYFLAMKHPLAPLQFAPLGLQLMAKNKVTLQLPSKPDTNSLSRLFDQVRKIEEAT